MSTVEEITLEFNSSLLEYIRNMAKLFPGSTLSNNLDLLEKMISKYPNKFIDQFVLYVLKYKDRIDASDEDFLLNHNFEEELKGKNSVVQYVFEAKSIWEQLNDDNKQGTFLTLQVLCYYTQEYFLKKYQ
tara:strand:- start:8504 stop:8893 length:390 start_codon:yes stop_codon:yes gene_type:complete